MPPSNIIDDIIRREGPATNDPTDRGGRTAFGISKHANLQAWADDKVTEEEAREIYERKYLKPFIGIQDQRLLHHLVDWGVTSGPTLVAMKLQEYVGAEVDGLIGPQTLAHIEVIDQKWLNNQLMTERLRMIGRVVSKDWSQAKFVSGWINRAVEFLL